MNTKELIEALGQLKVQTGSLVCLGCGHEHTLTSPLQRMSPLPPDGVGTTASRSS